MTLLTVAALVAAANAEGRVGVLDPTFGEAGKLGPQLEKDGEVGGMAVGPDGSIVMVKERTIVRFLSNGEPDPGFSDGGRVELAAELEGLDFSPSDLAIDSKGRVLVSGSATDPSQTHGIPDILLSIPASWAVVVRLTAGGELDPSFGEGRGFVRSDYGMHPGPPDSPALPPNPDFPAADGLKLKVDSRDRPVLLVATPGPYGPCWGHGVVSSYPRAVVRLTTAGAVDAEFGGGDGIAPLDRLAPSPEPVLALDPADQPVVGGGIGSACPHRSILFRLGVDGGRLTGFGVNGARTYARRYFDVLAPSGATILSGIEDEVVLRVGPDGAPDRSFGKGGQVTLSPPAGEGQAVRPVAVDARGRTLIAGTLWRPKLPERGQARRHHRKRRAFFAVSRLLPNGEVDRAFGKRGWIVTPIGPYYEAFPLQATVDPRGRLVVLGRLGTLRRGSGFVIARYLIA